MVSPKRLSSMLRRVPVNERVINNADKVMTGKGKSKYKPSVVLVGVVTWCILTTLYFATTVERRSLATTPASSFARLRSAATSFQGPGGPRSLILKLKEHSLPFREDDVEEDQDTADLEVPFYTAESEGSGDSSEDDLRNDLMSPLSSSTRDREGLESVPDEYVESEDFPEEKSVFVVENNDMEVVPTRIEVDVLNGVSSDSANDENADQYVEGQAPSNDEALAGGQAGGNPSSSVLIAVEIPTDLKSPQNPPVCDLLPLRGGRYFWRNRQRLVDKDKSEICGPQLLIIGAKKCGTTNIADMLLRHPRMRFNSCNLSNTMGGCRIGWFQGALKQGKVFDGDDFTHVRRRMVNGWLDEFGKRLPKTNGVTSMTFDKSTSYMDISFFPEVVEYAKAHLPNAKIVATLCNPAERLYSEFHSLLADPYQGYKNLYWENEVEPPTDFGAFVNYFLDEKVCKEKEGFCNTNRKQYLKQGDFLHNLRPWYDTYGRENVLVVNMEDHPSEIVKSLLQHVGHDILPESEYPWNEVAEPFASNVNKKYEGRASSYQYFDNEIKWLEQYYAPQNEELAMYLDIDWPRKWNCRVNSDCHRFSW